MSEVQQKDFYEILKVRRNASPREIERAYRMIAGRLSFQRHEQQSFLDDREDILAQIEEAYETLSDGDRREAYDQSIFGLSGSLILGFLDLQASQAQNQFYNDVEEWLSSMSLIAVSKTGTGNERKIQEDGVPVYVQALLEQTAESVDSLQKILGRGEDERRNLANNIANLTEKMSEVADQIKNKKLGIASICIGGGEATAILIENIN